MARAPRDYAAEQRRRNELARARGFTSRGAQRRRIEAGKVPAIQPARLRSPTVIERQKSLVRRQAEELKQVQRFSRQVLQNEQYSTSFANRQIAKYDYANALPGVSLEEYTASYNRAFVGPRGYDMVRRKGGSAALRNYFVNVTGYFTADEYETRYGHVR